MAQQPRSPVNLEQVRTELFAQGSPWTMGTTSVTELNEDQRVVRLGVPLPSDRDIQARKEQPAAMAARARAAAADGGMGAGLPASFDARNVGGNSYVTPVKDQGDCGSCVAFGTLASLETTAAYTRGQPGLQLDLSEAHLFYTHGPTSGADCDGGWWPRLAFTACRDIGVTYEDYFPYSARNRTGATLNGDWPNRLARAAGFSDVTGNPAAIKQHIYTYGAVDACFIVYQDFYSYRSGVYRHVTGDVAGGHCVALIGWDDAQGCWIGKNSWGPGWGDGGFFKIAYGDSFIEDYPGSEPSVMGATGVLLRAWARGTRITGLWSDASERNAWAFARDMGWLKITAGSNVAQHSMLLELAAAKGANRPVNLFQDNGTITEDYVL